MPPETDNAPAGLSLQEYLGILRRRRAIILQAFVLISVVGVVMNLLAKPVYQASAKMLVEGPSYNLNTVDSSNPLSSLFQLSEQQTVDTQVEVLQSGPLMDAVEKQAGPASLAVSDVKDTNVVDVTAEAGDPKRAADAPNALLKLYIDQITNQNLNEMERARQFMVQQGKIAHQKLARSEAALQSFKQKNHVTDVLKNRDEQIANVNAAAADYQRAKTDLTLLRAQIAANQSVLNEEPKTARTQTRATNTAIAGLEEAIRSLEVQRVGLVQPGGLTPNAPQVRALDAQIKTLRQRLAIQPALSGSETVAPNPLRAGLESKLVDLRSQLPTQQTLVRLAAQRLAQARAHPRNYTGLELTLDRLNREHDAAASDDKNFTDKQNDLILREKAHHATATIIERAQPPSEPIRPKRLQGILFACLIGLFTGVCLALLQEFLDDRINSVEDAGRVLALPSLGHVPALSAEDAHLMPQMKGLDPASESYRVLRTNIHFVSVDAPLRTLLVTSSNPGEGKTTTAANLAFAMAMDGKKVILVDTDLRRPSLHKLLDLPALPGLTDVLLGHAALEPREVMPGLSVLVAGSTPPNPGELLNSRTFRNLVETLAQQADIVIFDSAPVLVAADSVILASQMDGTIMVVETGMTKKGSAKRALDLLKQARATVLGIAYNKMRAQDGAGYYYYYQYQYGTTPSLENGTGRPRTLLPTTVDFDPAALPSGHDADEGTKK